MKRYVLLGTVGAGKSTLYAALHGIACDEAKKTQAMQYDLDGGVDTPGEFFCHPMYYPALLSTTVDTDVLIYVHPANDPLCRLPAGFLNIYTQREVICAITKVDLPDADFEATLQLVREVGFIQAFSFKYSRRAGTPAAVMPGQVEEKAKTERLNALQELLSSQQLAFNRKCVGQTMPVLFESKGRGKNALYGRTPYMQNLNAELDKKYLNQIVNIEITAAGMNALSGKMKG